MASRQDFILNEMDVLDIPIDKLNENMLDRFSTKQIVEISRWANELMVKVYPTVDNNGVHVNGSITNAFVQAQTNLLLWRYLRPFIKDDEFYIDRLSELKHKVKESLNGQPEPHDFDKLVEYLNYCVENLI